MAAAGCPRCNRGDGARGNRGCYGTGSTASGVWVVGEVGAG